MMRPAFAFALLISLAPNALGAPTPEQIARAKEIYTVGSTAYAAQLYPDAEQAFRDVYEILPNPDVLYNLALTLEKQHKWGLAADTYERYLKESKSPRDRRVVEKRAAELRERERRKEESATATAPVSTPAASQPGNGVLKLGENDDTLISIDAAPAPPPASSAEPSRPIYKRWWLWAAIGGVLVAAGAITVAVVATSGGGTPATMTTFPDFGPGAHGALLRF